MSHNRHVIATTAYNIMQTNTFRPEYTGLMHCRTNIHPVEFPSNAYVASSFYEKSFPYLSGGCDLPDTSSIREFKKAGEFCIYTQPKFANQGGASNPTTERLNLFSKQNETNEYDTNWLTKNTRYEGNYSSFLYQPNHDQSHVTSSNSTGTGIFQNTFERTYDSKSTYKNTISRYPSFSELLQTPSWASSLPTLIPSRYPKDTSVETAQTMTRAKSNPRRSERYPN